jgi:hypothetical protein
MNKQCYFIATILLTLFSSVGSAATQSFWATNNQSDTAWAPKFLNEGGSKSFNINYSNLYNLGNNLKINSAKLWLLAVDDYYGSHCSAQGGTSSRCNDDNNRRTQQDPSEYAKIVNIEGMPGNYGSPVEISEFKWYDLNINVASYLSKVDGKFSATVKAACGDFWYKNAKIVVDYDLKPVPVPAAIWLFGSALMGLTGMKRKSITSKLAA